MELDLLQGLASWVGHSAFRSLGAGQDKQNNVEERIKENEEEPLEQLLQCICSTGANADLNPVWVASRDALVHQICIDRHQNTRHFRESGYSSFTGGESRQSIGQIHSKSPSPDPEQDDDSRTRVWVKFETSILAGRVVEENQDIKGESKYEASPRSTVTMNGNDINLCQGKTYYEELENHSPLVLEHSKELLNANFEEFSDINTTMNTIHLEHTLDLDNIVESKYIENNQTEDLRNISLKAKEICTPSLTENSHECEDHLNLMESEEDIMIHESEEKTIETKDVKEKGKYRANISISEQSIESNGDKDEFIEIQQSGLEKKGESTKVIAHSDARDNNRIIERSFSDEKHNNEQYIYEIIYEVLHTDISKSGEIPKCSETKQPFKSLSEIPENQMDNNQYIPIIRKTYIDRDSKEGEINKQNIYLPVDADLQENRCNSHKQMELENESIELSEDAFVNKYTSSIGKESNYNGICKYESIEKVSLYENKDEDAKTENFKNISVRNEIQDINKYDLDSMKNEQIIKCAIEEKEIAISRLKDIFQESVDHLNLLKPTEKIYLAGLKSEEIPNKSNSQEICSCISDIPENQIANNLCINQTVDKNHIENYCTEGGIDTDNIPFISDANLPDSKCNSFEQTEDQMIEQNHADLIFDIDIDKESIHYDISENKHIEKILLDGNTNKDEKNEESSDISIENIIDDTYKYDLATWMSEQKKEYNANSLSSNFNTKLRSGTDTKIEDKSMKSYFSNKDKVFVQYFPEIIREDIYSDIPKSEVTPKDSKQPGKQISENHVDYSLNINPINDQNEIDSEENMESIEDILIYEERGENVNIENLKQKEQYKAILISKPDRESSLTLPTDYVLEVNKRLIKAIHAKRTEFDFMNTCLDKESNANEINENENIEKVLLDESTNQDEKIADTGDYKNLHERMDGVDIMEQTEDIPKYKTGGEIIEMKDCEKKKQYNTDITISKLKKESDSGTKETVEDKTIERYLGGKKNSNKEYILEIVHEDLYSDISKNEETHKNCDPKEPIKCISEISKKYTENNLFMNSTNDTNHIDSDFKETEISKESNLDILKYGQYEKCVIESMSSLTRNLQENVDQLSKIESTEDILSYERKEKNMEIIDPEQEGQHIADILISKLRAEISSKNIIQEELHLEQLKSEDITNNSDSKQHIKGISEIKENIVGNNVYISPTIAKNYIKSDYKEIGINGQNITLLSDATTDDNKRDSCEKESKVTKQSKTNFINKYASKIDKESNPNRINESENIEELLLDKNKIQYEDLEDVGAISVKKEIEDTDKYLQSEKYTNYFIESIETNQNALPCLKENLHERAGDLNVMELAEETSNDEKREKRIEIENPDDKEQYNADVSIAKLGTLSSHVNEEIIDSESISLELPSESLKVASNEDTNETESTVIIRQDEDEILKRFLSDEKNNKKEHISNIIQEILHSVVLQSKKIPKISIPDNLCTTPTTEINNIDNDVRAAEINRHFIPDLLVNAGIEDIKINLSKQTENQNSYNKTIESEDISKVSLHENINKKDDNGDASNTDNYDLDTLKSEHITKYVLENIEAKEIAMSDKLNSMPERENILVYKRKGENVEIEDPVHNNYYNEGILNSKLDTEFSSGNSENIIGLKVFKETAKVTSKLDTYEVIVIIKQDKIKHTREEKEGRKKNDIGNVSKSNIDKGINRQKEDAVKVLHSENIKEDNIPCLDSDKSRYISKSNTKNKLTTKEDKKEIVDIKFEQCHLFLPTTTVKTKIDDILENEANIFNNKKSKEEQVINKGKLIPSIENDKISTIKLSQCRSEIDNKQDNFNDDIQNEDESDSIRSVIKRDTCTQLKQEQILSSINMNNHNCKLLDELDDFSAQIGNDNEKREVANVLDSHHIDADISKYSPNQDHRLSEDKDSKCFPISNTKKVEVNDQILHEIDSKVKVDDICAEKKKINIRPIPSKLTLQKTKSLDREKSEDRTCSLQRGQSLERSFEKHNYIKEKKKKKFSLGGSCLNINTSDDEDPENDINDAEIRELKMKLKQTKKAGFLSSIKNKLSFN